MQLTAPMNIVGSCSHVLVSCHSGLQLPANGATHSGTAILRCPAPNRQIAVAARSNHKIANESHAMSDLKSQNASEPQPKSPVNLFGKEGA